MSSPTSSTATSSTATSSTATSSTATPAAEATTSPLETTQGKTTIADGVVSKVAGLAAREVSGVYGFGGSASRAFGALTERIPGARSSSSQGVSVEVGERQAAIDLVVVVEYGAAITDLARSIRRNVTAAVEQMTGLEVVEVNVNVADLHVPEEDDEKPAPTPNRVQ